MTYSTASLIMTDACTTVNRERSFLVRQTFSWKSCRTKIAISNDSTVVGYGCIRRCIDNRWIVSPLYADSPEIAGLLLREMLRDFDFSGAPEGILLGFLDKNSRWTDILKRIGFQDAEWCYFAGFTKECIQLDTTYSLHTMEF